jgi:mono/diheme cytochrome c family protein
MGAIGAIAALGLELWTSGWDYPQITAGKPYFSWEAFIPVTFELTVLFATFTAGLGMLLLLNRLPLFRHPMLRSKSMPLITRDKFALAVESSTESLDVETIAALLRKAGANNVEIIEEAPFDNRGAAGFFLTAFAAIALFCVVAGYLAYWGIKLFPILKPMIHMLDQPRLNPQREDWFFSDGFGMRMPVPGTVRRGSIPYTIRSEDDAGALANPLPAVKEVLQQGRQSFGNYCSVCHGILGNGAPTLTAAYGAKPTNLSSRNIMELADGKIYHVIVMGKNTMPSYAADLSENERWAAVHYVRVLQRALNAKDEDIRNE